MFMSFISRNIVCQISLLIVLNCLLFIVLISVMFCHIHFQSNKMLLIEVSVLGYVALLHYVTGA